MADQQNKAALSPTAAMENQSQAIDAEFLRGLRVMEETTFPKECRTCGNVYQDSQDFIERTVGIGPKKGVKLGFDDDETRLLEFFRNCHCGSTLYALYAERRDYSENGERRRAKFDELVERLGEYGIERGLARIELRKLLRGEESGVLAPLLGHERTDIDLGL